jgi:hypothetical protein
MNWRRTPLLSLLLECLSNYWYISSHLRNHWCENWILDIGKIWSSDTSFFRKYSNIETTWSTLLKIMKMVYSKGTDKLLLSSNFWWYIIISPFKTFGASLISNIQATPQMMLNIWIHLWTAYLEIWSLESITQNNAVGLYKMIWWTPLMFAGTLIILLFHFKYFWGIIYSWWQL